MKREADMAIWVASLSETWVDIEKTPSVMGMMPVFVKLAFVWLLVSLRTGSDRSRPAQELWQLESCRSPEWLS